MPAIIEWIINAMILVAKWLNPQNMTRVGRDPLEYVPVTALKLGLNKPQ